jgi:hypothetical protein
VSNRAAFILFPLLLLTFGLSAQDLANIKNQKPFQISGSIGGSYIATITNDSNRIPMPSFWNANVMLNVNIYGVSIPLSAVLTNGNISFYKTI